MGQPIEVSTSTAGDVLLVDTDRNFTGQDGSGYGSAEEAAQSDTFPAQLARRLLESDDAVDHVFVASNQVVVRRRGGWTPETAAAAAGVVEHFYVYYRDAAPA